MHNNTILVSAGVAIAIASAGFVFFGGDAIDSEEITGLGTMSVGSSASYTSAGKIAYESAAVHSRVGKETPTYGMPHRQKPEKPLPLGNSTYAGNHRYKIAIYDPTQLYKPSEAPKAKKYVTLEGSVDGKPFNLKVPDYFLEQPDSVQFSVTDTRTHEKKTMNAAFLSDLYDNGDTPKHKKIAMNFDDIEGYGYSERNAVLPSDPQ